MLVLPSELAIECQKILSSELINKIEYEIKQDINLNNVLTTFQMI